MHEFAITQSILDVALQSARQHNANRLAEIHVAIGSLTGIVEDSLRFYFDAMSLGTLAEGAQLIVHLQPAVATCAECGESAPVEPPFEHCCPHCGSTRIRVRGGDALVVERIAIAVD